MTDALILDSFAGSGTTAHAVLKANAKDGGTRRFILVEGEDYADTLTAERVRRAIKGYAWVGTQRETLLEEKITFTQFKKAADWLAKVDAIKREQGLADEGDGQGDLVDQAAPKHPAQALRQDRRQARRWCAARGRRAPHLEMAPRPGRRASPTARWASRWSWSKLLSGEKLPTFEALGAWLFYTATGGTLPPTPKKAPAWLPGRGAGQPCVADLPARAELSEEPRSRAHAEPGQAMQAWGLAHDAQRERAPKGHLVFAPAKYLSNKQLQGTGVDYAPLPFALYREA